jgi:hypothetical protein
MYRITSQSNVQMASPDQGWSLTPGANHFESDMPEAVAAHLVRLTKDGFVKVEVIDGAQVSDWKPPEPKATPKH